MLLREGPQRLNFGDGNSRLFEDYLEQGQDPGKNSRTLWDSPERTECLSIHPSISLLGLRRMKEQGRESSGKHLLSEWCFISS